MSTPNKILLYFTAQYPFGSGEQFIENEILELSKYYQNLFILPYEKISASHTKTLPENITIIHLPKKGKYGNTLTLISNPLLVFQILLAELTQSKWFQIIKKIKTTLIEIANAIHTAHAIQEISKEISSEIPHYYSTWMNEWALALSILYHKKKIDNFSFKMRGYDLFDERRTNQFMPFRKFIFNNCSSKMTMSIEGMKYLNEKGYKDLKVNYPGLNFNRKTFGKPVQEHYVLVSCSNLIPLKRVNLIAESLKFVNIKLKWIHFGDGPEMQTINEITKDLPQNILTEFHGNVPNKEVIHFYENNFVDGFIHLSLSEGFGFAVAEAFSFGIPAILYPGGAIKELIDETYCQTIFIEENPVEIGKKIESFLLFQREHLELRNKIISSNREKFDRKRCGKELFDFISNTA